MTKQAFASEWGLSYSDFEFLTLFGVKSRVMIACQLLFFRQHGHFPTDRGDLAPDVISYVADQIGVADDLTIHFPVTRRGGNVRAFSISWISPRF